MRKLIVRISVVAIALACNLTAFSSVQAQAPAQCAGARDSRFYDLGVRKGQNLARQAINRVAPTCDDIEGIEELRSLLLNIVGSLVVPPAPSQAVQCHFLGQVDGLLGEVENLQIRCHEVCLTDGSFIGRLSALLYCELSIALGGLVQDELFNRLRTTLCGQDFQLACDQSFAAVAAGDLECVPFTEDPFTEVFLETQNNQCAANPE